MKVKTPVDALRERLKVCTDSDRPELIKIEEELRDVLIEYVAFLRKHGMKVKLRRTWAELIDEK